MKLGELTEGSMANLRVQAGTVTDGILTLNLIQAVGDLNTMVPAGTIDVDLDTGEVTGEVTDPDTDLVDTLKLALDPGDVVQDPTLGLMVVTGVSTDGSRLNVAGATVYTSNLRKVGHVDLETDLDL